MLERLAINSSADKKVYETVANFISLKPSTFAKQEVYHALLRHLLSGRQEAVMLKCLALIINCDEGKIFAEDLELISVVTSTLLDDSKEEEILHFAIMALTSCMLNPKTFENPQVPWKELTKLLVHYSYTKRNKSLQESAIQALRVMSDKASVKDELRKVYKGKIRRIFCLSLQSEKLKADLVQWIDYQNYKSNDSSKYSKLFI